MPRSKKSSGSSKKLLSEAARRIQAVSLELALGVSVLALLVVSVYYGWKMWGRPITKQAEYCLTVDSIELPPQPAWIRADVRAEAVRDASLEGLSIFDKDLTVRVYQAFKMQAWVAQVNRVSKDSPARVIVDLEYRQPVAWVEIPPGMSPDNETGLLPVDATGVLLPPGDFDREQASQFPWISVPNLTPWGLPGTSWGDPRVTASAQIAALLADIAPQLGAYRIVAYLTSGDGLGRGSSVYTLATSDGVRFVWGSPPGREAAGEPSATHKKLRLVQLAETLAKTRANGEVVEFDLRDPNAGLPQPRTASRGAPPAL